MPVAPDHWVSSRWEPLSGVGSLDPGFLRLAMVAPTSWVLKPAILVTGTFLSQSGILWTRRN